MFSNNLRVVKSIRRRNTCISGDQRDMLILKVRAVYITLVRLKWGLQKIRTFAFSAKRGSPKNQDSHDFAKQALSKKSGLFWFDRKFRGEVELSGRVKVSRVKVKVVGPWVIVTSLVKSTHSLWLKDHGGKVEIIVLSWRVKVRVHEGSESLRIRVWWGLW